MSLIVPGLTNRLDPTKSALIVVDVQNDFVSGSLAVSEAYEIIDPINQFLKAHPWALKIATKDWHPADHISFASNHPGKSPFVDKITLDNGLEQQLWPVHCVQHTMGSEFVDGLEHSLFQAIVHKGIDSNTECYSAFCDASGKPTIMYQDDIVDKSLRDGITSATFSLRDLLRKHDVTDIFIVGLAGDYCVKSTAIDGAQLFEAGGGPPNSAYDTQRECRIWVVKDLTRSVAKKEDMDKIWMTMEKDSPVRIMEDVNSIPWFVCYHTFYQPVRVNAWTSRHSVPQPKLSHVGR